MGRRREQKTIDAMIRLYCRAHHGTKDRLCDDCRALAAYAEERLTRCVHGDGKPVCEKCKIHCYRPAMRERVVEVMRYAGRRMLWRHPILALGHLWDRWRSGRHPDA